MQLHNLLDRSESLSELYSQAISRLSVATLVLDESGSVLQINPVAEEILARSDGLKLVGGRLEATYPSDNRELQRLIRSAFAPDAPKGAEAMSVTRPSGLVNLGVVVESIPSLDWAEEKGQPAALVYIRDAVEQIPGQRSGDQAAVQPDQGRNGAGHGAGQRPVPGRSRRSPEHPTQHRPGAFALDLLQDRRAPSDRAGAHPAQQRGGPGQTQAGVESWPRKSRCRRRNWPSLSIARLDPHSSVHTRQSAWVLPPASHGASLQRLAPF